MALIAVLAVSAVVSGSASANWKVGGAYLEAGKTEAFTATNVTPGGYKIGSFYNEVFNSPVGKCTMTGKLVGGTSEMTEVVLTCAEMTSATKCTFQTSGAPSGTVQTWKIIASGGGSLFSSGNSEGKWFNIKVGKCPYSGDYYVTGTATATTSSGAPEAKTYNVTFPETASYGLGWGSKPAHPRGSFELTLNSGKSFGNL